MLDEMIARAAEERPESDAALESPRAAIRTLAWDDPVKAPTTIFF